MTGDMEAKIARIDERTEWLVKTLEAQNKCDEDHEERIRVLENSDATTKGRDSVLAALVALGVSILVSVVSFILSGGRA